jgi:hypothetical protein
VSSNFHIGGGGRSGGGDLNSVPAWEGEHERGAAELELVEGGR